MSPLLQLDYFLTLLINGCHSSFFDQFFFLFSKMTVWIPLYLTYIFLFIRKYGKNGLWIILALILILVLSDQLSSGLLKPLVARLRPSHDPLLVDKIHIIKGYTGGAYGFVSSHAANTAGFVTFLIFILRNKWHAYLLVTWALLTSYSRIYLGVHFFGDVFCGILIGVLCAFIVYRLYVYLQKKIKKGNIPEIQSFYFRNELIFPTLIYMISLLVMFIISV